MKRVAIGLLIIASALTGCAGSPKGKQGIRHTPVGPPPISNTDPCAARLHEVSGAFLLYFAMRNTLPQQLEQMKNLPGGDTPDAFVCPETKKRYEYVPNGIFLPEQNARIILFDPEPTHSGYRWAISIADPIPGQALVTKVIALPESFFILHPPSP